MQKLEKKARKGNIEEKAVCEGEHTVDDKEGAN